MTIVNLDRNVYLVLKAREAVVPLRPGCGRGKATHCLVNRAAVKTDRWICTEMYVIMNILFILQLTVAMPATYVHPLMARLTPSSSVTKRWRSGRRTATLWKWGLSAASSPSLTMSSPS